jgi:hypothetical protein
MGSIAELADSGWPAAHAALVPIAFAAIQATDCSTLRGRFLLKSGPSNEHSNSSPCANRLFLAPGRGLGAGLWQCGSSTGSGPGDCAGIARRGCAPGVSQRIAPAWPANAHGSKPGTMAAAGEFISFELRSSTDLYSTPDLPARARPRLYTSAQRNLWSSAR